MKKTVAILFGGQSTEYEVSLKSATSVINNLDREKYDIVLIGITKEGKWRLYDGDVKNIAPDKWYNDSLKTVCLSHGTNDSSLLVLDGDRFEKLHIDVVFPVLHGANGEDGTVQGLFELSGVKYVGVGLLTSCVGMDKAYTKVVMANANIDQADWVVVHNYEMNNADKILDTIENKLGYPAFVKPANAGSSIGIGKAKDRASLLNALNEAFKFDRKVIVEEFLTGREVECAVIGARGNIRASRVGEILPDSEFYDYESKYSDSSQSKLIIPATFKGDIEKRVRETAVKVFEALDGKGLSRVDFFVNEEKDTVKLNEINTLPGFTNISMYPKLMMETGMTYSELLDELINIAFEG